MGNRTFKKTSYISGGNFPSSKNKKNTLKKFLIFREMELSSLKLKKLLYLKRELAKPENQKFLIFRFTFFVCLKRFLGIFIYMKKNM